MKSNIARNLKNPRWRTTYVRRRATVTVGNEGVTTPTYDVGTPQYGICQPASQADLKLLPEGTSLMDTLEVYTDADLRGGDQNVLPDVVVYLGAFYRVMHFEDWRPLGYVRVLGIRFYPAVTP